MPSQFYREHPPPPTLSLGAVLVTAACLGAASVAAAQEAGVSGTVADTRGNVLGAADIVLEELGMQTSSGNDGTYSITDVLMPGIYTVRARVIGYRSQAATVTVRFGETATQDFSLAVDPLMMEVIVVTATHQPRVKLETSTAVTTMSSFEIEQAQPRSTADLLKSVPGFYVESSGGGVNNNLFVRGLPADGSYRYVVLMEDGMMAHDANDLFFIGADNFVRVDENIERMEAVRGGSSALFGSNAPGGVVNLINRTGGSMLRGVLKASVGTDGFARYDLNANGPLSEDWRFNIGGFYRFDDGVRDPGYPAARGGQLKLNVTRFFDQGSFTLYAKYINDRNIFYLPTPQNVSGFPSDGTMASRDATFLEIPLPRNNGDQQLPLADGIAQVGGTVMADLQFDLGNDWSVRNKLRFMNLDHQWNALLPFELVDATTWANGFADLTAGETTDLTFTTAGTTFNTANGLLNLGGLWHVEKPMTNFSDQIVVNKTIAGETPNNFTFGVYFGHYTANNRWFFNNVLTNVQTQPLLVDLVVRDAGGAVVREVTDNGFRNYLDFYVNGFGNATLVSVFAGDEIEFSDRVRLDLGVRFEHDDYEQNVENTETFDLGGPTDADDNELFGNRTFTRRDVDFDEWAASVGLNYLLSDRVSVYVRGSRGYKMPLLDQYLFSQFADTAETLYQAEGGVKVSAPGFGLSAVAYWVQLSDFPSQDARVVNGVTVFETAIVGKARTIGFELEAVAEPAPGFRLTGIVTLQDHEYTRFIDGGVDLSGNWIRRIPKVILNFGGSYSNRGFSLGGDWQFFGKRFADNANTITLGEFGYVNARASYTIPRQGVTLSLGGTNLLDGDGLTEGNPRTDEAGAPAGPVLARSILPRRGIFSVRYDF